MGYLSSLQDRLTNPRLQLSADHAAALDLFLHDIADDHAARGTGAAGLGEGAGSVPLMLHRPRIAVTPRHPWPDLAADLAGFRWILTDLRGVPGAMWQHGQDELTAFGHPDRTSFLHPATGVVATALFRLLPEERPRTPGPRLRSAPVAVMTGRVSRTSGCDARLWLRQIVVAVEPTAQGPSIALLGQATADLPLTGTATLPGQVSLPTVIFAPDATRPAYAIIECGVLFHATADGPQLGCLATDTPLALSLFPWAPSPAP
jgi:hypothetical protein